MSRVHPSRRAKPWIATCLAVIGGALISCFNSDALFYAECRREADDCGPAGSEPQGSITPRACFTPRADAPGYCTPQCNADRPCDPPDDLRAASGSRLQVQCFDVDDPGPPPVTFKACVLTCTKDEDCPPAMACEDYDGLPPEDRTCVPTGQ